MKSIPFGLLTLVLFAVGLISCADDLPQEKFDPFPFNPEVKETSDSLFLEYISEVACPVQFKINTNFADPKGAYATRNPIVILPYDTLNLKFKKPYLSEKLEHYFSFKGSVIGNPAEVDIDATTRYAFPFPKGRRYKIIQGYNGKFSHHSDYSRYAIDFALSVGDTVCASRDGIVVGVIKEYNVGGKDQKYRDYANFITLYHNDGTFTQYVHLKQNGAFVSVGDTVKMSQPIGLAGITGFTSIPHLHFSTLMPKISGVVSFPVKFFQVEGKKLRRGMKLEH
jgi:hypothetical protein